VLASRFAKTGGTPYYCTRVETKIGPGLTLSAAAINGMRRDALNSLTAQRGRREVGSLGKPSRVVSYPGNKKRPEVTVQVTTLEQITPKLLKFAPSVLYVPLHILFDNLEFCAELTMHANVCAVLPRILRDAELSALQRQMQEVYRHGVHEALVGNLGMLRPARACGFRIRGDFGLNLYNSASVNIAKKLGLESATLSFEMTLPQIRDVSKAVPCEIFSYGRMPLMVTENCLIRQRTGQCTCNLGTVKLTDKTGAEFPIIKDGNSCRSVLLNGKKLNWLDRQSDLSRLGLWATRLYFTTENPKEVDQVLAAYQNPPKFDPGAFTRGLYLRGLE